VVLAALPPAARPVPCARPPLRWQLQSATAPTCVAVALSTVRGCLRCC
jgi:hypothetical protein